jgi:hypothetical protein
MNLARSVADVLNDHVVSEVECIDGMYFVDGSPKSTEEKTGRTSPRAVSVA